MANASVIAPCGAANKNSGDSDCASPFPMVRPSWGDDAPMIAAWHACRDALETIERDADPDDYEQSDPLIEAYGNAIEAMKNLVPASTLGVALQLRVALAVRSHSGWLSRVAFDLNATDDDWRRLALEDVSTLMVWKTIKRLETMFWAG